MKKQRTRRGVSLIELVIAIGISVIPISLVGLLLVGGQHSWEKTYSSSNRQIEVEGQAAAAIFGLVGRKSERDKCSLYSWQDSQIITPAFSPISASLYADAVEFCYFSKGTTEYAFFYLNPQDKKLRVDYSQYPRALGNSSARTVVLAENVTSVQFSRTIENNVGQGCVRMKMTLKDPVDDKTITVLAATLMRN